MINKKNLLINLDHLLLKKQMSENIYYKYFVREFVVDNHNNIFFGKIEQQNGLSFYEDLCVYKHPYIHTFTFSCFVKRKPKNLLLNKFLKSCLLFKQKVNYFLLLKVVRRGYLIYSFGMLQRISSYCLYFLLIKRLIKIKFTFFLLFDINKIFNCFRLKIVLRKNSFIWKLFYGRKIFSSLKNSRLKRFCNRSNKILFLNSKSKSNKIKVRGLKSKYKKVVYFFKKKYFITKKKHYGFNKQKFKKYIKR